MFALMPFLLIMIGVVAADQASFASNSGNLTGVHDPVHFNSVHVNRGGGLDQDTGRLLITFAIGGSATDKTVGHEIVSFFNEQEELHIRSDSTNLYSTPTGKLTSWGTVSLSQAMGVGVGFGVCRTSTNVAGRISFDRVWTNVGNSWDTANNQFVAPVSGIYFLSFSIGSPSTSEVYLHLNVNGEQILIVYRFRSPSAPTEVVSRSVMVQLLASDQVHIESKHSGYSNNDCLTTFSGFLYSSLRDEQLAWAVYRSSNHVGSADPLVYEHVLVNEGAVWFDNRAHCHLTGLYYVNICTGIQSNGHAQLAVMKGSEVQGEMLRSVSTTYYGDTYCRSMIIHCNAGENLRVTVSSSSSLYGGGSTWNLISFTGFYLFP